MPQTKPFPRTYRPSLPDDDHYIEHPQFAQDARQYIKAAELIYKDYCVLIDYIEPADCNLPCYSIRIYELFFRICTEIEANMKAILRENHYKRFYLDCENHQKEATTWNIKSDYYATNITHHLYAYEVIFPNWTEKNKTIQPFKAWENREYHTLPWYKAYNDVKHNRHEHFSDANFGNLISSLAALAILLSAQFKDHDFIVEQNHSYGFTDPNVLPISIGIPLQIKFPTDWDEDEKYDFSWFHIREQENPFTTLFQ
jgi:hypothetical protein